MLNLCKDGFALLLWRHRQPGVQRSRCTNLLSQRECNIVKVGRMEQRQADIRKTIVQYITETYNIADHDSRFSASVDLFEEGYVDSLGLVKFIAFLEETFEIEIEEDYLYDERFLTISGQSDIIFELLNE